jgi:sirohydrochlorin cobaltochelatase
MAPSLRWLQRILHQCVEAIEDLIKQGATHITVVTTMFTPGGAHSEIEIPEILLAKPRHPDIAIQYAWPFDASRLLKSQQQVQRFM